MAVEKGHRGLRQSDAVFSHVKNLPDIINELSCDDLQSVTAVGVSDRPRAVEGSYMPCFLVGVAAAETYRTSIGCPLYRFSHQQGHIAAAIYGAEAADLWGKEFLAWHLSGGTSELLYVKPDSEEIVSASIVAATSDISAGQAIDRAGVAMGLGFPAGKGVDMLAQACSEPLKPARLYVGEDDFSLSGIENKVNDLIKNGTTNECIARFVLDSIYSSVFRITQTVLKRYPGLPLLCSGGVISNTFLRTYLKRDFGARFAPPALSADNAAGIAVLTHIKHNGGI